MTFTDVDQDMAGEYICKATSTAGAHQTKAHLHVHGNISRILLPQNMNKRILIITVSSTELTGPEREIWLAKKGKLLDEKKKKEKEKEDKKTKKEKGAKLTKEEYLKQTMMEKWVSFENFISYRQFDDLNS